MCALSAMSGERASDEQSLTRTSTTTTLREPSSLLNLLPRSVTYLRSRHFVRRGECDSVRQQLAATATTNTNLFYLLLSFCLRLTAMFTFSSTPLSPYLPIPIYTDCALTFTPMYVCSCPTLFSLCLFANPFQRFCFSFSYQYVDWHTSADTSSISFAPRFFLMRWCPVRNLTNTFPHNPCTNTASRAPTLRCIRASYPKQYNIVARELSTKAPPNSTRDIIKVNTGKFRHLLTRFTITRDVMRVTLTTKLFHEAFAPKQKHWPFFAVLSTW